MFGTAELKAAIEQKINKMEELIDLAFLCLNMRLIGCHLIDYLADVGFIKEARQQHILGEVKNIKLLIQEVKENITDEIEYQDKLEKQIELEVSKRTKQYEIMCHQSRLAAMGEMIDSIAHQWRQPLNSLGIIVQSLRHISSQKNIDNTLLQEIESDIMNKINYMSQTIDDFSTFFRINKDKEQFDILISIEDAIRLILVQLNNHNIKIEIEKKDIRNFEIFGFSNEFRQVILNLIHNAMMQIVSKNIVDGKIKIEIKDINNNIQIDVIDNAEGVKKEDMPKIFDPYFSTKEKGSGIGLYMSKVIIENHMNGILKVRNIKDGAKFTIMLAKE